MQVQNDAGKRMSGFKNRRKRGCVGALAVAMMVAALGLSAAHAEAPSEGALSFQVQRDRQLLTGIRWRLTAAYGPDGAAQPAWLADGFPISVNFSQEGRLSVWVCNRMTGQYSLGANRMVNSVSAVMASMATCDGFFEGLDARAQALFSEDFRVRLTHWPADRPQLTLRFADGSRWELIGGRARR